MSKEKLFTSIRKGLEEFYKAKCIMQHSREGAIDHYLQKEDGTIAFHRTDTFEDSSNVNMIYANLEACIADLVKYNIFSRRLFKIDEVLVDASKAYYLKHKLEWQDLNITG